MSLFKALDKDPGGTWIVENHLIYLTNMIGRFVLFVLFSAVSAQLYYGNDVVFDYPEEAPVNYFPLFDSYPEVLPEYRVIPYPPPSYSHQMWTGCGCASAKTYGDYIRSRSKSRGHRLFSYYQTM